MQHEEATESLLKDFDKKPEALELLVRDGFAGSRPETIRWITATVSPNFVRPDEFMRVGQIAQNLSEWHLYLAALCSEKYKSLTEDLTGSMLGREQANTDPELQTLQAIRRGVRAAMNSHYRSARGTRHGRR
jgi:hypothetical protein